MYCKQCGNKLTDGARFCVYCGAIITNEEISPTNVVAPDEHNVNEEVDTSPTMALPEFQHTEPLPTIEPTRFAKPPEQDGEPIPESQTTARLPLDQQSNTKLRARWVKSLLTTLSLILLVAAILFTIFKLIFPSPAPISQIIPADSIGVITADTNWWWDTLKEVRQLDEVKKGLQQAETTMNISIKNDILPWVGKSGISVLDVEAPTPNILLLFEVRDHFAFLNKMSELQQKVGTKYSVTWSRVKHEGITYQQGMMDLSSEKVTVAFGQVGGWLVCALGEKSMERCIDAWKRKSPSLQTSNLWKNAVDQLPARHRIFIGLKGDALASSLATTNPSMQQQMSTAGLSNLSLLATLGDTSNGLHLDVVSVLNSENKQRATRDFIKELPRVNGDILSHLPAGTIAAVLITNPGKWMNLLKQSMLARKDNNESLATYTSLFSLLAPVQEILDGCKKELALALIWHEKQGLSLTVVGNVGSKVKAKASADKLKEMFQKMQAPIVERDNTYLLTMPTETDSLFSFQPCWSGKDDYFRFATHPICLDSLDGKCTLKLPGTAQGSYTALVAKMDFLYPLIKRLETQEGSSGDAVFTRKLGIDNIQLVAFINISTNGKTSHGVIQINNWDWRHTMSVAIDKMQHEETASPVTSY